MWPSGTIRPSGVCVLEGGGERPRESGAGSRVKGGADPGGARGSRWPSGRREGVVSDGAPGFNRDVRRDKDGPDRPAEWSCHDRAAILSIPYTALSAVVTPSAPFCLIHATSLVVLTYFICFSQSCGSVWCVKAWRVCVCPHSCQNAVWNQSRRGRKRYRF